MRAYEDAFEAQGPAVSRQVFESRDERLKSGVRGQVLTARTVKRRYICSFGVWQRKRGTGERRGGLRVCDRRAC